MKKLLIAVLLFIVVLMPFSGSVSSVKLGTTSYGHVNKNIYGNLNFQTTVILKNSS